jgi:predicted nucleic acid-binding protein
MFAKEFAGRVLAFDESAAQIFAKIVVKRYRLGRPISQFDAAIAAIMLSHGAVLATKMLRTLAVVESRFLIRG